MGRNEGFGRNAPPLEPPSEIRPTGARERLSGRDSPSAAGRGGSRTARPGTRSIQGAAAGAGPVAISLRQAGRPTQRNKSPFRRCSCPRALRTRAPGLHGRGECCRRNRGGSLAPATRLIANRRVLGAAVVV